MCRFWKKYYQTKISLDINIFTYVYVYYLPLCYMTKYRNCYTTILYYV